MRHRKLKKLNCKHSIHVLRNMLRSLLINRYIRTKKVIGKRLVSYFWKLYKNKNEIGKYFFHKDTTPPRVRTNSRIQRRSGDYARMILIYLE